MKKILAILLCLLLIGSTLTLASCDELDFLNKDEESSETLKNPAPIDDDDPPSKPSGIETLNGKTPEELYEEALEKVSSYTNYTMTTEQIITMSFEGQEQDINQTLISKANGHDSYVKSTNDMTSNANTETWYVDEWLYTIQNDQRLKANITWQEMQDNYMPEGATGESSLMNIPEDWFVDVKFKKDGSKYYIKFVVSGEEYLQYMQSTALGVQLQGVDDVIYKVYFDAEGNLGDIITEFDFVVTDSGYTVDCHAVSTSKISNIGTTTIEAPEGSFTDLTGYM